MVIKCKKNITWQFEVLINQNVANSPLWKYRMLKHLKPSPFQLCLYFRWDAEVLNTAPDLLMFRLCNNNGADVRWEHYCLIHLQQSTVMCLFCIGGEMEPELVPFREYYNICLQQGFVWMLDMFMLWQIRELTDFWLDFELRQQRGREARSLLFVAVVSCHLVAYSRCSSSAQCPKEPLGVRMQHGKFLSVAIMPMNGSPCGVWPWHVSSAGSFSHYLHFLLDCTDWNDPNPRTHPAIRAVEKKHRSSQGGNCTCFVPCNSSRDCFLKNMFLSTKCYKCLSWPGLSLRS